jgi:ubiquinone/menaquinone biosynthesis C-methylase UbiE
MEYDTEQMTAKMIKKQSEFKDKIVLEIGCGGGEISSFLANDTEKYIGIDPDTKTISDASQTYDNVDFWVGTGESLAFSDSRFDLVLFTLSLHHQNSTLALKEADRVLKNDGELVIIEPSIKGEFQQFFHLFNDETLKIQNAYRSLIDSGLTLKNKDTFNTIVRFEDNTDLCNYAFDRAVIASGDANRIIEKLNQLQPDLSEHSPIILRDTIDIYLLTKV